MLWHHAVPLRPGVERLTPSTSEKSWVHRPQDPASGREGPTPLALLAGRRSMARVTEPLGGVVP
ncbi:hypothetical protein SAMN05660209_00741 [Geodermatophilus africanus]|uniref:Uncharacterized protein n=1 Tax=Geodermatophilus africanus TaxID=1137993 RepID=A0A1H3CTH2_9ACTN|nr:hypothetical protein SAMN05660209_00741 [Geodermatophilus africanus]